MNSIQKYEKDLGNWKNQETKLCTYINNVKNEHIVKKSKAFLFQHNGNEGIPGVFIITEQLYPLLGLQKGIPSF